MVAKKKPTKAQLRKNKQRRSLFLAILSLFVLGLALVVLMQFRAGEKPKPYTQDIPEQFVQVYQAAAKEYGIDWFLLAAVHRVETKFSTVEPMISGVGAIGPMQFMPCTFVGWGAEGCQATGGVGYFSDDDMVDPAVIKAYGGYGVDANRDGKADPWNLEDAVYSTANFLADNGAKEGKEKQAIFKYNHSDIYVKDILFYRDQFKKAWSKDLAGK
ncbi:lytic transglycosylase domain-containing protein [Listeria grandensis]|nr:lytic transglycosylase domain-containing protein [Listeria grandensis]